jgi:hypothetical protein
MFAVQVHAMMLGHRVQRYLIFETYSSAINCKCTLEATEQTKYSIEDYFEAGRISRTPDGEVVNEKSIETDFVISYMKKTYN